MFILALFFVPIVNEILLKAAVDAVFYSTIWNLNI